MNYAKHKNFYTKCRKSKTSLDDFLKDINLDDYIIIKGTGNFRILEEKDIEKYANFLLIKKDDFSENNFNRWIEWIKNNVSINYLIKPLPNFNPFEKIKEI